ncbi:MAG: hypothetical protein ACREKE_06430 [bacterium]
MARFMRFGAVLLVMVGLSACAARASAPKSVVLDDFERVPDPGLLKAGFNPIDALRHPTYPNHDFDVETSGYASVTSISKQAAQDSDDKPLYEFIQGKSAAQVRFTVPGDYRVKGSDDYPQTWETGFGLSTSSHTPLKVTDWSPYRYFDFRAFNPSKVRQTLYVRYSDADANVTVTAVDLPLGECEVEIPLEQLSQARLDPSDMKEVMLYLDTAGQDKDPVLMFDQLALYDTDSVTRAKLEAEGGDDEDSQDTEDWGDEDQDVVRKVLVVHPGQALPVASSSPAATAPIAPAQ